MNCLTTLNSLISTGSKIVSTPYSSNTTANVAVISIKTSSLSGGYVFVFNTLSTSFTTNEIGATIDTSGNVALPAGNYMFDFYASGASVGQYGVGIQAGPYRSPAADYSVLNGWKYSYIQGSQLTLGYGYPSSDQVRIFFVGNPARTFSEGKLYIRKIVTSDNPSGNTALTKLFMTTTSIGWNILKMDSANSTFSKIPGLSYNSSTGDFSFPKGNYVVTSYVYTGSSAAWGMGFQTTSSASTPSSVSTPGLDAWSYGVNSSGQYASDSVTRTYVFTSNNAFRIYLYTAAVLSSFQSNVVITKF